MNKKPTSASICNRTPGLKRSVKYLCLCALLFLPTGLTASLHIPALTVIAHPNEQSADILRKNLRAIFGMRMQTWSNGRTVTVYVLDDSDMIHQHFCKEILGMLPYRLRRNWDRLFFSGTGKAPILVDSAEEMRNKVANTPGAIGYLPEELIDESVSVLRVEY